jgi:hypothetical protein
MTILVNSIYIDATPDRVWAALASLDLLGKYDSGRARELGDATRALYPDGEPAQGSAAAWLTSAARRPACTA